MFSSRSITRRFTPPTCTLEIQAKSSSLSRWTKRKAFKDIQFQLSFDDPRLTEDQQVTIKGDRTQLEQLTQVVTSYVKDFLQQSSPEQILALSSSDVSVAPVGLALKPQGLVAHELFFGSLGDRNSGEKIKLSAVQLFDLVTALEEYQVEIAAIPNLNSSRPKKIPTWATAASIFFVVGLTSWGLHLFNQSYINNQTASSLRQSESDSSNLKATDGVIPPQVTKSPNQPVNQGKLQDPLSSGEPLPPPPPVDAPKAPPANVPDPAKYPLPNPNQTPTVTPRTSFTAKPKEIPIAEPTTPFSEPDFTIDPKKDTPEIPNLPPLSPSLLPTETDISNNSLAKVDLNDPESSESRLLAPPEESTSNPQLEEIEQYFRQQWQPPAELKQTIEYRLVVGGDGSIVRITPIGKASIIFLDRTNIPLLVEPFISPNASGGNHTVRLLLSPDGEVRTFLENVSSSQPKVNIPK